jgi:hypothetical protein
MQTSAQFAEESWYHVAGTYDYSTGACQTFVNGTEDLGSGSSVSGIDVATDYSTTLGARNNGLANRWQGEIDEVRISSTLRSAAWLKFTYHNIFEPDHELTIGSEETQAGDSIIQVPTFAIAL